MIVSEPILWVVIEVSSVDGKPAVFVEPGTLSLEFGFIGTIVWSVFTEGYALAGVSFANSKSSSSLPNFNPLPDPDRPGCFSTAAVNTAPGTFPYTITVLDEQTGKVISGDPVVENEPPPTMNVLPESHSKPLGLTA